MNLRKIKHLFRWRSGWKTPKKLLRPTEDDALHHVARRQPVDDPIVRTATRNDSIGDKLLIFMIRRLTGDDIRSLDDVLQDTHDFDYKQRYMRIVPMLDRKGRITYWNERQKQHQKERHPPKIADILNKQGHFKFMVSVTDVEKARAYRLAQADEQTEKQ